MKAFTKSSIFAYVLLSFFSTSAFSDQSCLKEAQLFAKNISTAAKSKIIKPVEEVSFSDTITYEFTLLTPKKQKKTYSINYSGILEAGHVPFCTLLIAGEVDENGEFKYGN